MTNEANPILEVKNLKKYFKTGKGMLHAVDDVSFSIRKGTTLGVVGDSGCGKSPLGRTIIRLEPFTDGAVYYEGENVFEYNKKQVREFRKKMQLIFQDPYSSLNPRNTVYQLIAEQLVVNKVYKDKADLENRVRELMDIAGLAPRLVNSYPHELDGGRRQRIGLARALSMNPSFIVCDEPVSALDVSIQAQILNLLMDLQDQMGLTYMFITHDLSVVKHISDEIAVLYVGQLIEKAPSDELFKNPLHPYTKMLLSAIPVPSLESRSRKKEIIKGEVTNPIDPKPGCRFASRCKYCMSKCTEGDMELKEIEKDHFVMCRLFD